MSDEKVYVAVLRKRIREARRRKGYSQEEVAELVGISPRHYQRYEARGQPGFSASLLTVRSIGKALGADLTSLVREPSLEEVVEVERFSS